MSYISEFRTHVRHVKGSYNEVAVALYQNAIDAIVTTPQFDFSVVVAAQREDEELKHLSTQQADVS